MAKESYCLNVHHPSGARGYLGATHAGVTSPRNAVAFGTIYDTGKFFYRNAIGPLAKLFGIENKARELYDRYIMPDRGDFSKILDILEKHGIKIQMEECFMDSWVVPGSNADEASEVLQAAFKDLNQISHGQYGFKLREDGYGIEILQIKRSDEPTGNLETEVLKEDKDQEPPKKQLLQFA